MATYWPYVREFYASFLFGLITLVLPAITLAAIIGFALTVLARRSGARTGWLLTFTFILAFALVGSVSGLIAGTTLEGIVGAVLAAVLGLVSSLLTYLFGQQALRAWRPVIPLAIGALLATTLVGLVLGGSRRAQILNSNNRIAWANTEHDRVTVPVELQRQTALMKRCIDESPDFNSAVDCGQSP